MDELGDTYDYGPRYWYPHLSTVEAAIWDRFMQKFPRQYDTVQYDVKIGKAPDFVTNHIDEAIRAQAGIYKYKIDVLAHAPKILDIIELKDKAQFYTVGQVKGYRHTFMLEHPTLGEPRCIIVAASFAPGVEAMARTEGVLTDQV